MACIRAARKASGDRPVIDVVVNGNRTLADQAAQSIQAALCNVRVWFLKPADKAHAWNTYVHSIWTPHDVAFFIDGYAYVKLGALQALSNAILTTDALAASGVPSAGPSAHRLRRRMLAVGGIHGNLYALRGETLAALRRRNFKLPLGIYRSDPVLGAIVSFNLNPLQNDWDVKRIAVCANASWDLDERSLWRALVDAYRRRMRQAQGVLENLAVRQHLAIDRRPPETLPPTVAQLVGDWIKAHPVVAAKTFLRRPLCYLAARKLSMATHSRIFTDKPELLASV